MKLTWATDIHLNFLDNDSRERFYQEIIKTNCNAVVISGDIAEAPSISAIMKEMSHAIKKPVYFVLGNHDYYKGNVNQVRQEMTDLTNFEELLFWLPASGIQILDEQTILLGQDGWADGRLGDYSNSNVTLNDSRLIADLFQERMLGKFKLLEKMQQLADADAQQLQEDLAAAISKKPKNIIILTHVPPFKEACQHMGKISDDNWLPYFSSKITGDVLQHVAEKHPQIDFLVLCGHTHSSACIQPLNNLCVKAGHAEYYYPEIQEIIHTSKDNIINLLAMPDAADIDFEP